LTIFSPASGETGLRRLIRGPEDKGCFVILGIGHAITAAGGFPRAAPVKRCGLAEAIGDIASS